MLDAEPTDQVIEMAQHGFQRRLCGSLAIGAQKAGGEVEADKAAGPGDGVQLPVGEIARVRAQGVCV